MNGLVIRRPDDWHVHLRSDDLLGAVAEYTACIFGRALVMPNVPAIENAEEAMNYGLEIRQRLECSDPFIPYMTIKLTAKTTAHDIYEARNKGVMAVKLYPDGVTTGAEGGISNFRALDNVFDAMQEVDLPLSIHGELPGVPILRREAAFLPILVDIAMRFPKLRIVMEHLTTAKAVATIIELGKNVAATITAHHLVLTIDDVIGGKMRPHNFCLPIAKGERDRRELVRAATSGNPKFFFGSDSAPHWQDIKESAEGAAGIFSAPVAMPLLAQGFEKAKALDKLESFTSRFGTEFYRVPLNEGEIELIKSPWQVPDVIHGVDKIIKMGESAYATSRDIVPFMAGKKLDWQVRT